MARTARKQTGREQWWLAVEWEPAQDGSIPWQVVTLAKYLPQDTYRALLLDGKPVVQFIFRKEHMALVSKVMLMFDATRTKYFETGNEIPHAEALKIMQDPTRWH